MKPERALREAKIFRRLDLTRRVVESRGWRYQIASEPPRVKFTNVRFLTGYRRAWLFDADLLAAVRSSARQAISPTISDIVAHTQQPKPLAVGALMHLLWRQEFTINP
jgi:hypothetical protein